MTVCATGRFQKRIRREVTEARPRTGAGLAACIPAIRQFLERK